MIEGLEISRVEANGLGFRVAHGGAGPPLLLLHGHPQTLMMWEKVAPLLAPHFSIVAPDLRGYGRSDKPPSAPDHVPHSKREMAKDQVAIMQAFGHERFFVAGHDRGGRVAYRLALDHPKAVARLAVLDILPTYEHFRRADMAFAMAYYHWFFLAQPFDRPERAILADTDYWFLFRYGGKQPDYFSEAALDDYLECYRNPDTVHATCEDYRAGATIDFDLDKADHGKRRIACPLLALWGGKGTVGQFYDVLSVWRDWADDVSGQALDCGHYLAEERPQETAAALADFFRSGD
ncbi:MAG TPA: alpha/beta hydrolase [Afifellaceae bacterium]|nr:alpha/beta hydrolase [Afifellaceae bacterium]